MESIAVLFLPAVAAGPLLRVTITPTARNNSKEVVKHSINIDTRFLPMSMVLKTNIE